MFCSTVFSFNFRMATKFPLHIPTCVNSCWNSPSSPCINDTLSRYLVKKTHNKILCEINLYIKKIMLTSDTPALMWIEIQNKQSRYLTGIKLTFGWYKINRTIWHTQTEDVFTNMYQASTINGCWAKYIRNLLPTVRQTDRPIM